MADNKKYMWMLFADQNISNDESIGPEGIHSFWLYDSFAKAKKEMLGMIKEYAFGKNGIFDGCAKIPALEKWISEVHENVDNAEDYGWDSTADQMVYELPDFLSSYLAQENCDPKVLENGDWYYYRTSLSIEKNNNLYFDGYWGRGRKLRINIVNMNMRPGAIHTGFKVCDENKVLGPEWFHVEIIKLEVNEPRI